MTPQPVSCGGRSIQHATTQRQRQRFMQQRVLVPGVNRRSSLASDEVTPGTRRSWVQRQSNKSRANATSHCRRRAPGETARPGAKPSRSTGCWHGCSAKPPSQSVTNVPAALNLVSLPAL
jgi:hypothetical protein